MTKQSKFLSFEANLTKYNHVNPIVGELKSDSLCNLMFDLLFFSVLF